MTCPVSGAHFGMLYVIIELLVERRLKVVVRLSICSGKMSDLIKPCAHFNRRRMSRYSCQ